MATDREAQLVKAAYEAGITSPKELANFMAQVGAESGGLSRLNEGFRYTKGPSAVSDNVRSALREGPEALNAAWKEAMDSKPEKLAELMYGGRMGNTEPGDGYRYHGRGYIQLTGKNQYRAAGESLGLDLVNKPERAAEPENASKIAVWYWKQNVQALAPEDAKEAGSIINTGEMGNTPNGLKHRQAEFEKWQQVLTPEVIERLAKGEIGATVEPRTPQTSQPQTQAPAETSPTRAQQPLLKQGVQGPEVRELQAALNALGYRSANGQPLETQSGVFGQQTDHAVREFQRAHGLEPVDGKVGSDSRAALAQAAQRPLVSEATHPNHAQYTAIARQLPEGTDPKATANITLQALENGITTPEQLKGVAVRGSDVHLQGSYPGARVSVDLNTPTPDLQVMSDHLAAQTQERTQGDQARRQQQEPQTISI